MVFCFGGSGSSGSGSGMKLMGNSERYRVIRDTWLQYLRPEWEAVCLVKA